VQQLETIIRVETIGPGCSRVYFQNGDVRDLDWKLYADDAPIFNPLKDPDYATSCKIVEFGGGLEWPDGVDWSAGAVHQAGVPVEEPLRDKQRRSA
jgi:hypothetical protein